MFEKEAYEYGKEKIDLATSMRNPQIETATRQGFKDGAEFGYNKANEWHKVKSGDLMLHSDCYSIAECEDTNLGLWEDDLAKAEQFLKEIEK